MTTAPGAIESKATIICAAIVLTCPLQNSARRQAYQFSQVGSREEPHLTSRVPEHDVLVFLELLLADVRDEAGHGFGRVGGIEEDRFRSRRELQRFA